MVVDVIPRKVLPLECLKLLLRKDVPVAVSGRIDGLPVPLVGPGDWVPEGVGGFRGG